jgi:hypothetical protein
LAAGITWTSCTANAQWAARIAHTSVIDAAGAIYVIGGLGGSTTVTYYPGPGAAGATEHPPIELHVHH